MVYSKSYLFYTNYPGISDTVMGMDGYGNCIAYQLVDNQIV